MLTPDKLCLIVDDDPSIRGYVATLLHHLENFETLEADCGRQALEIVKEVADALDLVVSDIHMPDGDGISLAHSLRELCSGVPVILISGQAPPAEAHEFEFIQKPFAPDTLLQVVHRVVRPKVKTT
jgi:DNA-binding NtrC family response regulator